MKRILYFHRNLIENCKTVQKWWEESNTVMWIKKTNTIVFFRHEGELGECKNVDNMNVKKIAENHNKRYLEA